MLTCITQSPEETAHLAGTIGKIIREGTVICLDGELGVGKTLFVRALARTLGVESDVTSPTFNLMNIYEAACPIVHFDLYRLSTEEELEDIGFYEYAEALEGIVLDHLTVARVAAGLGVSWHTANNAVLDEGRRLLIDDPTRFDGVRVIGVDEHVWRHTRRGDR